MDDRKTHIDGGKTREELIEDRRRAWSAPTNGRATNDGLSNGFLPVSAAKVSAAFTAPMIDFLENTVPLPRYRPERL